MTPQQKQQAEQAKISALKEFVSEPADEWGIEHEAGIKCGFLEGWDKALEWQAAKPPEGDMRIKLPEGTHPDNVSLLQRLADDFLAKMIHNQQKYGYSNEWLTTDWEDECRQEMMRHIEKGDPLDVAIYAAFMLYRGWSTKQRTPTQEAANPPEVSGDVQKKAETWAMCTPCVVGVQDGETCMTKGRIDGYKAGYLACASDMAAREVELRSDLLEKETSIIQLSLLLLNKDAEINELNKPDMAFAGWIGKKGYFMPAYSKEWERIAIGSPSPRLSTPDLYDLFRKETGRE